MAVDCVPGNTYSRPRNNDYNNQLDVLELEFGSKNNISDDPNILQKKIDNISELLSFELLAYRYPFLNYANQRFQFIRRLEALYNKISILTENFLEKKIEQILARTDGIITFEEISQIVKIQEFCNNIFNIQNTINTDIPVDNEIDQNLKSLEEIIKYENTKKIPQVIQEVMISVNNIATHCLQICFNTNDKNKKITCLQLFQHIQKIYSSAIVRIIIIMDYLIEEINEINQLSDKNSKETRTFEVEKLFTALFPVK